MAKLTGTALDDTIVGGNAINDILIGAAGNDLIFGYGDGSGIGGIPPGLNSGGGGATDNDTLNGGLGTDTLHAGGGNDRLDGGAGADSMDGGDHDDVYFVDHVSDIAAEQFEDGLAGADLVNSAVDHNLGKGIENLVLTGKANSAGGGNSLNNSILGNAGKNVLGGGTGDDTLNGGAGADAMFGGMGDDIFVVDNAGDLVFEFGNEGTDTLRWMRSVNLDLNGFSNVENAVLLGGGNLSLTGTIADNVLAGNAGANLIDGGFSADSMAGGGGNDKYIVDNSGDLVFEQAGGGVDAVFSSVNFFLSGQSVENLTLTGSAVQGDGNELANVIRGNDTNNFIDGLIGKDTMAGGKGEDAYNVDNAGDKIIELAGEGFDSVSSTVTYTLPEQVEYLFLFSIAGNSFNGTGNSLDNVITGSPGSNVLDGKGGADSLDGYDGSDTLIVDNVGDFTVDSGGIGNDLVLSSVSHIIGSGIEDLTLTGKAAINGVGNDLWNRITGNAGANKLFGLTGVDTLIGGAGADTMNGGDDGDLYLVDNIGDVAEESDDSSAFDDVLSSVSYSLHWTMDNLFLSGGAAISGTGNDDANRIEGNAGANKIMGLGGADTLRGGAGNDTLDSGFEDGVGDNLRGGAGNDHYILGHVSGNDDFALEELVGKAGGIDTVFVYSGYTLGANMENLTLLGTFANNGTGNELNNVITGNDLPNYLDGQEGADTLIGGAGDDMYLVSSLADVVRDVVNGGYDTVSSAVSYTLGALIEELNLSSPGGLKGTGNISDNKITGNAGDDTLDGKGGADTLDGSNGNDLMFVDNAGDVTTEEFGTGYDRVVSSASHTIGIGIEELTLTGTGAINGGGNDGNNIIRGNGGANILSGGFGADSLIGGAGNDSLAGDDGDDTLLGGAGLDTLFGSGGGDVFAFDKSSTGRDLIQNFQTGPAGDRIDIGDMLSGYVEGVSEVRDFVQIVFVAGAATLRVDANGLAGGRSFTDVAVLSGLSLTVEDMIAGGNLVLS